MGSRKITSRQYFKTAKVIHIALVVGVVLFVIFVSYFMFGQHIDYGYNNSANVFYVSVGVLGLWALFGGDYIFKMQIKKTKKQPQLSQKMIQYQAATLIKFALIEGVALFSVVAALITLSIWFLYISLFFILILASYYPTIERTIKELDLNKEEQRQVENPDAYISEIDDLNQ